MGSTANGVNPVDALLRFPGLVVRWVAGEFTRMHSSTVGSDGLTDAEGAEYEARFWKVANTPIPPDARLRAEREVQAGTRSVVHLRRSR